MYIDCWQTISPISITNIALLMGGYNPDEITLAELCNQSREEGARIKSAIRLLCSAVENGDLSGKITSSFVSEKGDLYFEHENISCKEQFVLYEIPHKIMLKTAEVARYLSKNMFAEDRFFTQRAENIIRIAQNKEQSEIIRTSMQLQAALDALEAIRKNPRLLKNSSPKEAVKEWVKKHHVKYGLTNKKGEPSENIAEAIGAVVNWQRSGGAISNILSDF